MEVSQVLKSKYDNLYSNKTEAWRKLGALDKSYNIISISKGHSFHNVVEIGAGDGNILKILSENEFSDNYVAVEISQSAIEQIKAKNIKDLTQTIQFDGYKLPFADKEFDLAICSHVIEHVEHPRILLREIKRISKKQIFEIPIDFSINVDKKTSHFVSYGHINIFTPGLFNFLLKTEGFEILKTRNTLYRNEIISFKHGKISLEYMSFLAKKALWKIVPSLMTIKPNAYTVMTR